MYDTIIKFCVNSHTDICLLTYNKSIDCLRWAFSWSDQYQKTSAKRDILVRAVFNAVYCHRHTNSNLTLCFPLSFLCDLTKIDDDLCCCQTWMVALNRTECTYGTSAIHAHTHVSCVPLMWTTFSSMI